MEEDILNRIAEAEAQAAAQKAEARQKADAMIAEAEKAAAQKCSLAEVDLAMMRAEKLKQAEEDAAREYDRALDDCRASARNYADGLLSHADVYVAEIVGRILK